VVEVDPSARARDLLFLATLIHDPKYDEARMYLAEHRLAEAPRRRCAPSVKTPGPAPGVKPFRSSPLIVDGWLVGPCVCRERMPRRGRRQSQISTGENFKCASILSHAHARGCKVPGAW
jgi:hypothetical protein